MVKEKMENKYLNEAIIGNKNMIATFTSKGELGAEPSDHGKTGANEIVWNPRWF